MPTRPKRPCAHPGCPSLVGHGQGARCPAHAKAQQQQAYRADVLYRGTAASRGYDAYHRRWRAAILARDPLCVDPQSRHPGVLVPSTEADHVIPISQGGARFDAGNGQGLCKACHSAKTLQQQRMNSAVVS